MLRTLLTMAAFAALTPELTASEAAEFLLPSLAAANAWRPGTGTVAASDVEVGGKAVVRLPCNFSSGIERAYWDADVTLDLAEARGLRFHLYCGDPSPIGGFTLYFRSGEHWYSTPFSLEAAEKWCTVTADKLDTATEGGAPGWKQIDRVRFSVWRGASEDTALYVAGFAVVPSTGAIAVVRAESAGRDARTVKDAAQRVGCLLDDLGIPFAAISDLDLAPALLEGKRVAVLPYNPVMCAQAMQALDVFVKGGGKIVSFYVLPAALAETVGLQAGRHVPAAYPGYFASIRPTDQPLNGLPAKTAQASWNIIEWTGGHVAAAWWNAEDSATNLPAIVVTEKAAHMTHILLGDDAANKALLLLSMIGQFAPESWEQAAAGYLSHAGIVGPFSGYDAARRGIRERSRNGAGEELLAKAEASYREAQGLTAAGRHVEAIGSARRSHDDLTRAWCAVQTPLLNEFRGFWCHDAFGVEGLTWDAAARILAENGFTAVFPNLMWGGVAYYPSDVLPVAPEVAGRGDQAAACLAACRKYGIECHVWKVNWYTGGRAPAAFIEQMQAAGRTQVNRDGAAGAEWLCPSHPDNQQLEIDAMLEVAEKYDVDGVHFDYIRYPDRNACYCQGCRRRFEAAIGRTIERWPQDVAEGTALNTRWLQFRRDQITRVVAGVGEAIRGRKPGMKVSAAVFRNAAVDRDAVGQDWLLWCEKGYVDFVCPMDYTAFDGDFERMVRQQRAWAGKTPCYPGIGLSVWPDSEGIERLIEQVAITRKLDTGGFLVFNYGRREATEILPLCGLGLTRRAD